MLNLFGNKVDSLKEIKQTNFRYAYSKLNVEKLNLITSEIKRN